jgi:CxxC motif-containing protein (DUF1111 family)
MLVPIVGCSTIPNEAQVDLAEQDDPVLGTDVYFGQDDMSDAPDEFAAADGAATDAGPVPPNLSPLGRVPVPLPGLTPAQLATFQESAATFQEIETVEDGLGPIFNGNSCGGCHSQPGPGGGSAFFETRFGKSATAAGASDGGPTDFDPLEQLGGNLQQFFSIGAEGAPSPNCAFPIEIVPPQADIIALRRTTPLFGLGLVDNVPDDTFRQLAALEARRTPSTAGHVAIAVNVADQQPSVSKFGWKAQVPNLLEFSGNAYVNEMGITTPLFPLENCPNGAPDCDLARRCDPIAGVDDDNEDVEAFALFMKFLAPVPRTPTTDAIRRGQRTFNQTGCANCHTPTLVTGSNPVAALNLKVFHPYSDFLLHDMGPAADGIGPNQGNASGEVVTATKTEMRTAPLWGSRFVTRFLHDGRGRNIQEAVRLGHDGQGARARNRFQRLTEQEQNDLVAFVLSL